MRNRIREFLCNEQGATALEYALIAAGISLGVTMSIFLFGQQIFTLLYEQLPALLDF